MIRKKHGIRRYSGGNSRDRRLRRRAAIRKLQMLLDSGVADAVYSRFLRELRAFRHEANPNGRYPICYPEVGKPGVCARCGRQYSLSDDSPCPAVPVAHRWGPTYVPRSVHDDVVHTEHTEESTMTKQRDVTRPPCQGFEPVDGHPDISLVAEAVDIGAYVFEPGYYFGTPYMDLEGPFGTLDEAVAAQHVFSESL